MKSIVSLQQRDATALAHIDQLVSSSTSRADEVNAEAVDGGLVIIKRNLRAHRMHLNMAVFLRFEQSYPALTCRSIAVRIQLNDASNAFSRLWKRPAAIPSIGTLIRFA
jgi:hypothetical protein